MKKKFFVICCAAMLIAVYFIGYFIAKESFGPSSDALEYKDLSGVYILKSNMQLTVNDLKIAAGNFEKEPDDHALLTLFVKDANNEVPVYVYSGDLLEAGDYRIGILDVDARKRTIVLSVISLDELTECLGLSYIPASGWDVRYHQEANAHNGICLASFSVTDEMLEKFENENRSVFDQAGGYYQITTSNEYPEWWLSSTGEQPGCGENLWPKVYWSRVGSNNYTVYVENRTFEQP